MDKTITIEVRPFEPVSVDLEGFQGQGCKGVADLFAKLGEETKRTTKPEFYGVGESHVDTTIGL